MIKRLPIDVADRLQIDKNIAHLKAKHGIVLRLARCANGFVLGDAKHAPDSKLTEEQRLEKMHKALEHLRTNGLVPIISERAPKNTVFAAQFPFRAVSWTKDQVECNGYVSRHRPMVLMQTMPDGTHTAVAYGEPLTPSMQANLKKSFDSWLHEQKRADRLREKLESVYGKGKVPAVIPAKAGNS